MRKGALQVEIRAQLASEQRVHAMSVHAPGKQVRPAPPEFARAGSREQEPEAAGVLVEKHLRHVEQRRHTLRLVDEHRLRAGRGRAELPFQSLGMTHVFAERARAGQIHRDVGFERGEQGGLSHLAGSEDQGRALV